VHLKKLIPVFLLATGVLVSIIVLETGLRIMRYKPELQRAFYLTEAWRVPDKEIIMINPAFLQKKYFLSNNYKKTIVALGDSFTEGYPVSKDNTYPNVLRELLLDAGCSINVINAGQGDTGTDQHLKLFTRYILPRLKPDAVIWSLYPNDIMDNIEKAVYTVSDDNKLVPLNWPKSWLSIRQLIYDNFPLSADMKNKSYLFNLLLKSTESLQRWQVPEKYKNNAEDWGLQKIRLAVEEMNQLAGIYGFDVYYVLIANQSLYLEQADTLNWKDNTRAVMYRKIENMLDDQVNIISARFSNPYLHAGIENENPDGVSDIFSDKKRDGNVLGDRHFNEAGYRLLAQKVFKHLDISDCSLSGTAKLARIGNE
jgi:lysophospholipase L1-like esterase